MSKVLVVLVGLLLLPWTGWAQEKPALPPGTLVEMPAQSAHPEVVFILSGDGGWADLDKQLGQQMSARGLTVLGFDALRYFDRTRSPDETARDVGAALAWALSAWHKERLVLIGFSFGAAVLPFILTRLPESLKSKVVLAIFLSGNTYANWEIHWGDWLHDAPHPSARPVGPEVERITGLRMVCVYGREEAAHSLCPTLSPGRMEIFELPGGHHFDENYSALADRLWRYVP